MYTYICIHTHYMDRQIDIDNNPSLTRNIVYPCAVNVTHALNFFSITEYENLPSLLYAAILFWEYLLLLHSFIVAFTLPV